MSSQLSAVSSLNLTSRGKSVSGKMSSSGLKEERKVEKEKSKSKSHLSSNSSKVILRWCKGILNVF